MQESEDGKIYLSSGARWLISGVFLVTLGWLSWTSLSLMQLKDDFYKQNRDLHQIITSVAGDVQWMKNEAQQGTRFTSRDGEQHETRISHLESKVEAFAERVIRLETRLEVAKINGVDH